MNPLMQPQPANPMMGQPPPSAPPQGMPQGMPPQQTQAPPPMPSPEQIAQAHDHLEIIIEGLMKLIGKPNGQLDKPMVFKAAADMIAKGCFPDPEHKQQLVAALVQLPTDEAGLRKALGALLMNYATMQQQLTAIHGPKGAPNAG